MKRMRAFVRRIAPLFGFALFIVAGHAAPQTVAPAPASDAANAQSGGPGNTKNESAAKIMHTPAKRFLGLGSVHSVALSPDGSLVAVAGQSVVRVFETDTGKPIASFGGHSQFISAVLFTPDGKCVISGSWDKLAILWNARTGEEIRRFTGNTIWVRALAISTDGSRILTGDKMANLWDLQTGKLLKTYDSSRSPIRDADTVAFMPDGKRFAIGGSEYNGAVAIGSLDGGDPQLAAKGGYMIKSLCPSPDGKFILAGGTGYESGKSFPAMPRHIPQAILIDALSGAIIRSFLGHQGDINAVAISPDGKLALTGSGCLSEGNPGTPVDDTARLWDIATGKELRVFSGHQFAVNSVLFSKDGMRILTGSTDGCAKLWDVASGQIIRTYGEPYQHISAVPSPQTERNSSWALKATAFTSGTLPPARSCKRWKAIRMPYAPSPSLPTAANTSRRLRTTAPSSGTPPPARRSPPFPAITHQFWLSPVPRTANGLSRELSINPSSSGILKKGRLKRNFPSIATISRHLPSPPTAVRLWLASDNCRSPSMFLGNRSRLRVGIRKTHSKPGRSWSKMWVVRGNPSLMLSAQLCKSAP